MDNKGLGVKMIKSMLKDLIRRLINDMFPNAFKTNESILMLEGKNASSWVKQTEEIDSLSDVEFKVYSQWGEDGIIEWLIQKLPISSNRFIEFGIGNYKEANTRFLIQNHNWRGLVIDSNLNYIHDVRNDEIYWKHDLTACHAFITKDNINNLITTNGFAGKIALLSIDIDGNDYWIWQAIEAVKPDIVICEYNGIFGDVYPITIPYEDNFQRTYAHYSNLYYGAGIRALDVLAVRKGYILLGSNSTGSNAFFIRKDLADCIIPRIKNKKAKPPLLRESRDGNNKLTFLYGLKRFDIIKHLQVVRIDTQETILLESLPSVYSDQWLAEMGV